MNEIPVLNSNVDCSISELKKEASDLPVSANVRSKFDRFFEIASNVISGDDTHDQSDY